MLLIIDKLKELYNQRLHLSKKYFSYWCIESTNYFIFYIYNYLFY